MYINNNSSFSYSAPQEKLNLVYEKGTDVKNTLDIYLKHFSEKAQITFDSLSAGFTQEKKK